MLSLGINDKLDYGEVGMPSSAISAKYESLRAGGLDLGSPQGDELDSGYGGRVQAYVSGRIWWHPTTGAHEVHGAILNEYLKLGGPGVEAVSGRRLLGYPVSDEGDAPDGGARISRFETGAILWGYGTGAVAIYGPFYTAWGLRQAALGYPLTPPMSAPSGQQIVVCECGLLVSAGRNMQVVAMNYVGPQMGNPGIVQPDALSLNLFRTDLLFGMTPDILPWMIGAVPDFLAVALQGRIVLQAVGDKARVDLQLTQHSSRNWPVGSGIEVQATLAPGAKLADRTLYGLAVVRPDGTSAVMRPHCIYAKGDWSRFGAMHATDIHVAARNDYFWRELGRLNPDNNESRDAFINFNEAFRAIIREANRLHAVGALDVMIVTGDLVDYQMEAGQDPDAHGGNMLEFERITRGMSPSPTGRAVEELRVPMFTTLGNHDYRVVHYELLALAANVHPLAQFASLNLLKSDASALQGGRVLELSADTALDMVRLVRQPPYYHRRINGAGGMNEGENSYTVALGRHRLVMLDSGADLGAPQDLLDIVFGTLSNEEDFVIAKSGSPNQHGVTSNHLELLAQAAQEAGDGIVLVGIHGPPLNIAGSRFEDYFRETTHVTASETDVGGYLAVQDPDLIERGWWEAIFVSVVLISTGFLTSIVAAIFAEAAKNYINKKDRALEGANSRHPAWIKSVGKRYFAYKDVTDYLDVGASKGKANDLLTLSAGGSIQGSKLPRPIDLLLCGHGHDAIEYRIESKESSGLRFYTDFYSRTPQEYYGTYRFGSVAGGIRIVVHPRDGAAPNAQPNDHSQEPWEGKEWEVAVPPYDEPLDRTADPRDWWARHRPLVMQTGAIGPIEGRANTRFLAGKTRPDPSFRGYRLVSVAGDVIQRVSYRRMADLDGPCEPWERWEGAHVRLRSAWKPDVVLRLGVMLPTNAPQLRSVDAGDQPARPPRRPHPTAPLPPAADTGDDYGTGLWRLEPLGDRQFRIREGENHERRCLNIESGKLARTEAMPGWLSAQWVFEETGTGSYRLRSFWKSDQFIHIESGAPAAGPIEPGWLSAVWNVELA